MTHASLHTNSNASFVVEVSIFNTVPQTTIVAVFSKIVCTSENIRQLIFNNSTISECHKRVLKKGLNIHFINSFGIMSYNCSVVGLKHIGKLVLHMLIYNYSYIFRVIYSVGRCEEFKNTTLELKLQTNEVTNELDLLCALDGRCIN